MSDSVFVERQRDRLVRAASQIAFRIADKAKEVLIRREKIATKGA
jgi:hypothetical protein